jgi:hypothetical protein
MIKAEKGSLVTLLNLYGGDDDVHMPVLLMWLRP